MKAVVVPVAMVLLLAASVLTLHAATYTVVPAGAAGPGLYLDKVGPLLDGSESLPIEARLPIIHRQPLWASYGLGEAITGGCKLYDNEGKSVRSASIIVELHRLTFTNPKTYYRIVFNERFRYDASAGMYRFAIPTDDLEAGFYQIRLGLPNGGALDPEFRIQIGDAVFIIEERPPTDEGWCGCGG